LFSQEKFIAASRKFVCVRLESYESIEHQKIVRSFLDGRFENTAFCLLSPDGQKRLSRSGRSPWMAFSTVGPRISPTALERSTVAAMETAAKNYATTGNLDTPVVQDFHSFRQALNVASGDQRLLLFVAAPAAEREEIRKKLSPVVGDPNVVGRFHVDFIEDEGDEKWSAAVSGIEPASKPTIFVIRSDKFGQDGTVLKQLPSDATPAAITTALLSANELFAKDEVRKVYSEHVSEGRRKRVFFEGGVEYGEDRDGDGKIDHRGPQRGPRR